jgi:glycine cleavage system H protein
VYPEELRYTTEHEWVSPPNEDGIVRVGITSYAQEALGDIVYVSVPAVGSDVGAGESLGEVESTKSVSDIYAPLSGAVVARNERLDSQPELVNSDPYGDGWIAEIRPADAGALGGLLDAVAYGETVAQG